VRSGTGDRYTVSSSGFLYGDDDDDGDDDKDDVEGRGEGRGTDTGWTERGRKMSVSFLNIGRIIGGSKFPAGGKLAGDRCLTGRKKKGVSTK
jgi:hypothetical protein